MQYLEYLPEPSVGANECNSTEHYNGLLHNGNFICAGGREARTQCKVRSTNHSIHGLVICFVQTETEIRQKMAKQWQAWRRECSSNNNSHSFRI